MRQRREQAKTPSEPPPVPPGRLPKVHSDWAVGSAFLYRDMQQRLEDFQMLAGSQWTHTPIQFRIVDLYVC